VTARPDAAREPAVPAPARRVAAPAARGLAAPDGRAGAHDRAAPHRSPAPPVAPTPALREPFESASPPAVPPVRDLTDAPARALALELRRQWASARRVDAWAVLAALDRAGLAREPRCDPDRTFAPADLSEQTGPRDPDLKVSVTFLGLLGAHTPLPDFAVDALQLAPQPLRAVAALERRLLDHLAAAIRRCAYPAAVGPARDDPSSRRLVDLAARGVGSADLPPRAWLRLLAHAPGRLRTAAGLAAALTRLFSDDLGDAAIAIVECVPDTAPLADSARSHLGRPSTALGRRFVLGDHVRDAGGRFRVRVATLSLARARPFFRGGDALRRLFVAVTALAGPLLRFDVEVVLAPGAAPRMRLSDPPPRLGVDTWTLNLHRGFLTVRHDDPG
jgi:type VI secretion system protein ImpH